MEANYDEKLQQAICQTIAEIKGWVLNQDLQTGAIFSANGDKQIYATPLYEGKPCIPIENEDGELLATIRFEPYGRPAISKAIH